MKKTPILYQIRQIDAVDSVEEVVLDGSGAEAEVVGRITPDAADLDDDADLTRELLVDIHGADIAPDRPLPRTDTAEKAPPRPNGRLRRSSPPGHAPPAYRR